MLTVFLMWFAVIAAKWAIYSCSLQYLESTCFSFAAIYDRVSNCFVFAAIYHGSNHWWAQVSFLLAFVAVLQRRLWTMMQMYVITPHRCTCLCPKQPRSSRISLLCAMEISMLNEPQTSEHMTSTSCFATCCLMLLSMCLHSCKHKQHTHNKTGLKPLQIHTQIRAWLTNHCK